MEFMRKYIHVAKIVKPVLTQESASYIADQYSRLRSQDQMSTDLARTSPVTARSLETMIRLSTAHAKARMSKTIDLEDAEVAVELVQFAYFKKVLEKEKKRRKKDADTDTEGEEMTQEEKETKKKRRKRSAKDGKEKGAAELKDGEYDPYEFSDTEEETPEAMAPTPKAPEPAEQPMDTSEARKTDLAAERLKQFKAALLDAFKSAHAQSIGMRSLMESINKDNESPFSEEEVQTALDHMQEANHIMVSDEIIFLI